jgi:hypothetical protein
MTNLSNLTHQTLEGEFADKQFSGLLVSADFTECNCTWSVTMRLLHTSSSGRSLASSLELVVYTLVASCFRGALPPVDLRAVCLVRAIAEFGKIFSAKG